MSSVHTAERQSARAVRLELRRFLEDHSSLPRVRRCSTRRIDAHSPVTIACSTVAHVRNIQRCGSLWACAWCAPKVRQHRAAEIKAAVAKNREAGGAAVFVTLTMPHDLRDRLALLWECVSKSWTRIFSGDAGIALRHSYGILGSIRAVEVTHGGENGWHVHLHCVVFLHRELDARELAGFRGELRRRWAKSVTAYGYRPPSERHGVRVDRVRDGASDALGQYLTKSTDGVAFELTRADLKAARSKTSRTPWEILANLYRAFAEDADDPGGFWHRDLALWREWEAASARRNAITWTPGLKGLFGIAELEDETIANAREDGDDCLAFAIDQWRRLRRRRAGISTIMNLVETAGRFAALDQVIAWGLDAWVPPPDVDSDAYRAA